MNDRIFFVGDPHGYFRHFMPTVEREQPAAVVLLGDIEADRPLAEILGQWDYDPARVWIIPGNHDVDRRSLWSNLSAWRQAGRDLHGQVQEIAGRRVAGLGGVFEAEIWHPDYGPPLWKSGNEFMAIQPPDRRAAGLPLKFHAAIWWRDYERLWDAQADILVTHEAPACHRYGFREIDDLAAALGVSRHYHGHHHETYAEPSDAGHQVHGADMAAIIDDQGGVVLDGLSTPTRRRRKDSGIDFD